MEQSDGDKPAQRDYEHAMEITDYQGIPISAVIAQVTWAKANSSVVKDSKTRGET